jgi:hypothetical protein
MEVAWSGLPVAKEKREPSVTGFAPAAHARFESGRYKRRSFERAKTHRRILELILILVPGPKRLKMANG